MGTASIITVRQLKEHTDEIVNRVREQGESIEVADAGEVVAVITPVLIKRPTRRASRAEAEAWLAELDKLAEEIGKLAPAGVSAADVVSDLRRDFAARDDA